jgi:hypothetical protein
MEAPLPRFPLFSDPLAYVRWTVSEFDPVPFARSKERHRLTIHERDLREIDGDCALLASDRFSERIKVVSLNSAAQAKYHELLDVPFDLPAHRVRIRRTRNRSALQDKHTTNHSELVENKTERYQRGLRECCESCESCDS